MADPLERLTNLLALLLDTRVPLSLDQIANELRQHYPDDPVARRGMFERDKALLRKEGIPLRSEVLANGATGYYIRRDEYELPDLGLDDAEKRALHLAVATVRLGTSWGREALWKIGGTTEPPPVVPAAASVASSPDLPVLMEARRTGRPVTFRYRSELRTFEPWGLVARNGRWYAVGHDRGRGEQRTFRVDRMEPGSVTLVDGSFAVPEGFVPAEHVPSDARTLGGGDPVRALVLVDRLRASAVVRELGEQAVVERHPDGGITVAVEVSNVDGFRSWLFGLLDHAVVLGPPVLRDEVVAWLESIVAAGGS